MVATLMLGLVGSLGHCVGMCVGVMLLLGGRQQSLTAQLTLQLGRVTAYALLGIVAGAIGGAITQSITPSTHTHGHMEAGAQSQFGLFGSMLAPAQGMLALLVACTAAYLALAILGRVPSPEVALIGLTRRWGRIARWIAQWNNSTRERSTAHLFVGGLFWGLLPCGLVFAALLIAATSSSPWFGALTMIAFGLGTCPALLLSQWIAQRPRIHWPRPIAAGVVLVFGAQMLFRGLAAWGWVEHLYLGRLMVW